MNERLYRLGMACLRGLCASGFVARGLDRFSKVWLRHRKLRSLLFAAGFDGVIDGGANIGEFAQIVRAALPQADLLCIEPHPTSAVKLRRQGFRVVEAALWKTQTHLCLSQPTSASTSCTVLEGQDPAKRVWIVEGVRLDSLAIAGSRLLIKLDLQGAEFAALEGMGRLWERCAGLLLEVSIGSGGSYEKMRELLALRGFQEHSTTNELEIAGRVTEADKLWLRSENEGLQFSPEVGCKS